MTYPKFISQLATLSATQATKTLCLALLLSTSQIAHAAKEYGNVVVSKVGTVIDGDSFKVDIDEWPPILGKGITVRIADIDAPELRGKCDREKQLARQAKQHLVAALRGASKVELKHLQRGKYFRVVADVYIDGALFSINDRNRLFFKKYENRGDWC
jgi:micrococcal nuclease